MNAFHLPNTGRTLFAVVAAAAGAMLVLASLRPHTEQIQAQSTSGDMLLLQLAERLLGSSPPISYPTGAGTQDVHLLPGALPPDLPFKLPLPPGSALLGSAVRPAFQSIGPPIGNPGFVPTPPTPAAERTDIVLDSPQSVGDILSFYKSAMSDLGWSSPPTSPYGPQIRPSNVSSALDQTSNATFCQSSSGPWLSLTAAAQDRAPADVRLHLETGTAGICATPTAPPYLIPPPYVGGYGLLPSLRSPDGVTVRTNGGGGGPGRFASDAVAITDMSVADLYAYYSRQLKAAGWTQNDGGTSDSLDWGSWAISDHDDYQGFLYVRSGAAAGQLSLHAEVASTDPNATTSSGVYYGGPIPLGVVSPAGGSCVGIALQPGQSCSGGIITGPANSASPTPRQAQPSPTATATPTSGR